MIEDIQRLTKNAFFIYKKEGLLPIFVGLKNYLKELILIPFAIYKIKKNKDNNLDCSIDLVFNGVFKLIKPFQVKSELYELLKILQTKKPENILEIGTAKGGSLFLFCSIAAEDALIISIDLPGGSFGGGYPSWKQPLYKSFQQKDQSLHLLRMDSHNKMTKTTVKNIINGKKFDFIFIDGDHSYNGVKKDFQMYRDLLNKNGMIAFHDIIPGPKNAVGGAYKFWEEIKIKYKSREIVEDPTQMEAGIGIIINE